MKKQVPGIYDYIRSKIFVIRLLKNISSVAFICCLISAVIVCSKPAKVKVKPMPTGSSGYDKNKIEQAKKTTILKRFIS